MTLAEQTPTGVDRKSSADLRLSASHCQQVSTLLEEPEPLDPQGLGDAEAVVPLGEVHVLGPDPRDLICRVGRVAGERLEGHRRGLGLDLARAQRGGGEAYGTSHSELSSLLP